MTDRDRLEEIRRSIPSGTVGITDERAALCAVRDLLGMVDALLVEIDQRDHIIHDATLDGQWAASAERGRIVAWLREPARKCSRCAGLGRVRDPVPYGDTSPCPDCHGSLRPSLEAAADDLEAQGTPEPLPADLLRKRVAKLEGALQEILALRTVPADSLEASASVAEIARNALKGQK